jgi:geranylgeranyl diphosphate synthase, type II
VTDLDEYLRASRLEIESALERYLPASPDCPPLVAEAMRYSLLAGGKRLRPALTLAAAEAVADRLGTPPRVARHLAMPAACAIEMIHTYSLIHDDLPAMDDDTLRRGRPTSHVVHGEGLAILAGDGLQAAAFGLLAREPDTAEPSIMARKLEVLGLVAEAAGPAGMVGGQAIDLEAVRPGPGRDPQPLDAGTLERMHAKKTGALIRASALSGAVMAGADRPMLAAIGAFAHEVGLAFQIVDDILDVEAGSVTLGKTAGKDAAAGKPTYAALFGVDRSRRMAAACVDRADAILQSVAMADSRLREIGRWILERPN